MNTQQPVWGMENGNQILVECSNGIETTGATSLGMPALNNYSQSILGFLCFIPDLELFVSIHSRPWNSKINVGCSGLSYC